MEQTLRLCVSAHNIFLSVIIICKALKECHNKHLNSDVKWMTFYAASAPTYPFLKGRRTFFCDEANHQDASMISEVDEQQDKVMYSYCRLLMIKSHKQFQNY